MDDTKGLEGAQPTESAGVQGWRSWGVLTLLLLAVILIPFALFGASIEAWTADFIAGAGRHPFLVGTVLGGLLVGDIVLPVPSSLVSTGAGMLLGLVGGTITSFIGLTAGGMFGYWLGLRSRGRLVRRILNPAAVRRLEDIMRTTGPWGLILVRPVPVLAEASVFLAGIGHMPFRQFLLMMSLSNVGLSLAYAAVGAYAATASSFLLAFTGAIALPLLGLLVVRLVGGRGERQGGF